MTSARVSHEQSVRRSILIFLSAIFILGLALSAPATAAEQTAGYHILNTWKLPGGGLWDYVTADSEARRLYVTRLDRVEVLDLDTGKLIGTVGGLGQVHGVALAQEFGHGFVTDGRDDSVAVFDLKTFEVVKRIALPEKSRPDAIAYDSFSQRLFTCNNNARNSTVIDAKTATIIGTIDFIKFRPEGIIPDGAGHIYFSLPRGQAVLSVDTQTLTVIGNFSVDAEKFHLPHSIAIDIEHGRLFVGCENNKMVVLDTASGKKVADFPLGDGHDAAAYDPLEKLIFTSNEEGTLTVVKEESPNKFTVLENAKTEKWGRTMAIDTKTHRAYVVAGKMIALKPIPGDEHSVPAAVVEGTFEVLVLGK